MLPKTEAETIEIGPREFSRNNVEGVITFDENHFAATLRFRYWKIELRNLNLIDLAKNFVTSIW